MTGKSTSDRHRPIGSPGSNRPMIVAVLAALAIGAVIVLIFVITQNGRPEPTNDELAVEEVEQPPAEPERPEEEDADVDGPLEITIHEDGSVALRGRDLSLEELEQALRQASELDPDQEVPLAAPPMIEWQHVARIVDLCREAGLNNISHRVRRLSEL